MDGGKYLNVDVFLTCTQRHVSTPCAILSARPQRRAILFHSIPRLALEGNILTNREVFSVAKAISRHTRIPAVYHCGEEEEVLT